MASRLNLTKINHLSEVFAESSIVLLEVLCSVEEHAMSHRSSRILHGCAIVFGVIAAVVGLPPGIAGAMSPAMDDTLPEDGAGLYRAACSSCHVTDSFRRVDNPSFDHNRTGYPLAGEHLRVSCEKCHRQNIDGGLVAATREAAALRRLPHERRDDCHADAHGGQLANRPERVDCAVCHEVQGWKPSTFTVERHAPGMFWCVSRQRVSAIQTFTIGLASRQRSHSR